MRKGSSRVSVAVQIGGALVGLVGLYLLAGLAWALVVAGGVLVAVGALKEAGVI